MEYASQIKTIWDSNGYETGSSNFESFANDWLLAMPCINFNQTMLPNEYRAAIASRLMMVQCRRNSICNHCGKTLDSLCLHAHSCLGKGNGLHKRHELVVQSLFACLHAAGRHSQINAPVQCLGENNGRLRPADILTEGNMYERMCIDVTIVSSLTNNRAHELLGGPVIQAATRKKTKHMEACRLSGLDFLPFAMDTTGLIEHEGADLIKRLAYQYAEKQSKSYAESVSILRRRISFAVQLGTARQIISAKSQANAEDFIYFQNSSSSAYCSDEDVDTT